LPFVYFERGGAIKHHNITLNHLRTFVVVARHGSFNRAADELSRSQPAVTLAIKQLEGYIGLKLFERTTRKVTPTTAGEKFIPSAERLLREFDMAIYDVTATADCRSGHVSMSVLPSVATRLLPKIISQFTKKYPDISVHLSDTNAQGVQRSVERNEVDFGIGSLWHPNSKLEFNPLLEDKFEFVCHRDHPLARKGLPVSWSQLQGLSFLGTGLTHALKKQCYIGNPKFEFSTTTTLFAMLRANLGVTVLPSLAIPRDDDLVSLPMIDPVETREICVIFRQDWTLSPAANAMMEELTEHLPALAQQLKLTVKSG
jgi:LysR family carnitine catabolism transcriptional activator